LAQTCSALAVPPKYGNEDDVRVAGVRHAHGAVAEVEGAVGELLVPGHRLVVAATAELLAVGDAGRIVEAELEHDEAAAERRAGRRRRGRRLHAATEDVERRRRAAVERRVMDRRRTGQRAGGRRDVGDEIRAERRVVEERRLQREVDVVVVRRQPLAGRDRDRSGVHRREVRAEIAGERRRRRQAVDRRAGELHRAGAVEAVGHDARAVGAPAQAGDPDRVVDAVAGEVRRVVDPLHAALRRALAPAEAGAARRLGRGVLRRNHDAALLGGEKPGAAEHDESELGLHGRDESDGR